MCYSAAAAGSQPSPDVRRKGRLAVAAAAEKRHWQRWVLLPMLLSILEAKSFQTDQLVTVCPKKTSILNVH